ncbi:hypothetical protein TrST_g3088 [Triparma strigata]|uniref:Uncharacterized protein n=1 Tax=Triparma strigata TaxID=1606541 RepID=A0A9W7BB95_9STRA|nr:hypothetical protein TrST_g3088 [Triparma strigata]
MSMIVEPSSSSSSKNGTRRSGTLPYTPPPPHHSVFQLLVQKAPQLDPPHWFFLLLFRLMPEFARLEEFQICTKTVQEENGLGYSSEMAEFFKGNGGGYEERLAMMRSDIWAFEEAIAVWSPQLYNDDEVKQAFGRMKGWGLKSHEMLLDCIRRDDIRRACVLSFVFESLLFSKEAKEVKITKWMKEKFKDKRVLLSLEPTLAGLKTNAFHGIHSVIGETYFECLYVLKRDLKVLEVIECTDEVSEEYLDKPLDESDFTTLNEVPKIIKDLSLEYRLRSEFLTEIVDNAQVFFGRVPFGSLCFDVLGAAKKFEELESQNDVARGLLTDLCDGLAQTFEMIDKSKGFLHGSKPSLKRAFALMIEAVRYAHNESIEARSFSGTFMEWNVKRLSTKIKTSFEDFRMKIKTFVSLLSMEHEEFQFERSEEREQYQEKNMESYQNVLGQFKEDCNGEREKSFEHTGDSKKWDQQIATQQLQASERSRLQTEIECHQEALDDMQGAIAMNDFQLSMLEKDVEFKLLGFNAATVNREIAYFQVKALEHEVEVLERSLQIASVQEKLCVLNEATPEEFREAATQILEDIHISEKLMLIEIAETGDDDGHYPEINLDTLDEAIDNLRKQQVGYHQDRIVANRKAQKYSKALLEARGRQTVHNEKVAKEFGLNNRDIAFQGFFDEVLEERGRRTTVDEGKVSVNDFVKEMDEKQEQGRAVCIANEEKERGIRIEEVHRNRLLELELEEKRRQQEAAKAARLAKLEADIYDEAFDLTVEITEAKFAYEEEKQLIQIKDVWAVQERKRRIFEEVLEKQKAIIRKRYEQEEIDRLERAKELERIMALPDAPPLSPTVVSKRVAGMVKKRQTVAVRKLDTDAKIIKAQEKYKQYVDDQERYEMEEAEERRRIMELVRARVNK